jgi:hypothetical protein
VWGDVGEALSAVGRELEYPHAHLSTRTPIKTKTKMHLYMCLDRIQYFASIETQRCSQGQLPCYGVVLVRLKADV